MEHRSLVYDFSPGWDTDSLSATVVSTNCRGEDTSFEEAVHATEDKIIGSISNGVPVVVVVGRRGPFRR